VAIKSRSLVLMQISTDCRNELVATARAGGYKQTLPRLKYLGIRVSFEKQEKLRKDGSFEIFIKQTTYNPEVSLLVGTIKDIQYQETTF
jgi:hypothetical protein